jgi:hypothetical protein
MDHSSDLPAVVLDDIWRMSMSARAVLGQIFVRTVHMLSASWSVFFLSVDEPLALRVIV